MLWMTAAAFLLCACGEKQTVRQADALTVPEGNDRQEAAAEETGGSGIRLYCLNVGKADAMILEAEGKYFVIDCAREENVPFLAAALRHCGISRLDGVFITHVHKDHAGGAVALSLSGIPVDKWYAPAIFRETKKEEHPAYLAAAIRGQEVTWLNSGDVITLGNGASIAVIGPVTENRNSDNNNSLVMRLETKDGSILFCGDMKEEEENTLLEKRLIGHSDVLKTGHHGDSGASSAAFLARVTPKAAVISTNTAEEPDTPASGTVKRLNGVRSKICVTQDYSDALLVELKAGNVTVSDQVFEGLPARMTGIDMRLDTENDTVILINNTSVTQSLKGYTLLFINNGGESAALPDITVAPRSRIVIGGKKSKGDTDITLKYKNRFINKNKRSTVVLIDEYGRAVCRASNGLAE